MSLRASSLALLVAICAATVVASEPTCKISGKVVGPDDQPLASARVKVTYLGQSLDDFPAHPFPIKTTTDSKGVFELTGLHGGWYRVEIEHDNYLPGGGRYETSPKSPRRLHIKLVRRR